MQRTLKREWKEPEIAERKPKEAQRIQGGLAPSRIQGESALRLFAAPSDGRAPGFARTSKRMRGDAREARAIGRRKARPRSLPTKELALSLPRLETRTKESNLRASATDGVQSAARNESEVEREEPPTPPAVPSARGGDAGGEGLRTARRPRRLLGGRGSSRSAHVGTRKMVNYARAGRSQGKLWWRLAAILTCKSIVELGYRGERLIEPSSSWFPPKFPSG